MSLVDDFYYVVDGYYAESDAFKRIEAALIDYERHYYTEEQSRVIDQAVQDRKALRVSDLMPEVYRNE